jgi:hypothetical protein
LPPDDRIGPDTPKRLSNKPALRQNDSGQQPTIFSSRTTIVLIPALVTTHNGEPVFTLRAEDFTVTDDGAPRHYGARLKRNIDRVTGVNPELASKSLGKGNLTLC